MAYGGCTGYVCVCNSMSVCMESDAKQDLKLIEIRHNKLSNSVFLFSFSFSAQLVSSWLADLPSGFVLKECGW